MRLVLPLAALLLLAAPAYAQTTPPASPPPQVTAAPPATPAPAPQATAPAKHHRLTMEQRFEQANTTHDGHLTPAQAKAGYSTVSQHFTAIDTDKKDYVTEDDIRAWEKAARDRRHEAQQPAAPANKS